MVNIASSRENLGVNVRKGNGQPKFILEEFLIL